MMTIVYAILLLIGFNWIPFGESSVSKSDGIKLPRAIYFGDKAKPGQFPYAVSLQRYSKRSGQYKPECGGSLITTMAILSAAHCVFRSGYLRGDINDFIGVLGTVDRMDRTNKVTFQEICIHSEFNETSLSNDIAMLVPSKPVKLGDAIKTIPLIGAGMSVVGMRSTVLGWGQTLYFDVEGSRMLRYANVNIVDMEVCEKDHEFTNEYQMCFGAGVTSGCRGDSGGPIVVRMRNMDVLVSIVSFGNKECLSFSSVGTNVSSFNTWIRNNVEEAPVFIN